MANVDLFQALRSKTRQNILKILMKREMHISGLARELGISVPQTSKHCKNLEEKGLIEKTTFGRTHVLKARMEPLYQILDSFAEETTLQVTKGQSILDALEHVAGVRVERADERGFVTSIDGEEGYYIYEVNGRLPDIPMDKYTLEQDLTVDLKKITHVSKKRLDIKVKDREGS